MNRVGIDDLNWAEANGAAVENDFLLMDPLRDNPLCIFEISLGDDVYRHRVVDVVAECCLVCRMLVFVFWEIEFK